jgi:hypothetical protein
MTSTSRETGSGGMMEKSFIWRSSLQTGTGLGRGGGGSSGLAPPEAGRRAVLEPGEAEVVVMMGAMIVPKVEVAWKELEQTQKPKLEFLISNTTLIKLQPQLIALAAKSEPETIFHSFVNSGKPEGYFLPIIV